MWHLLWVNSNNSKGGISSARNVALDIANGEYITFVDSDDTVEENLIEQLYMGLIKNKTDCSTCNMNMVSKEGARERKNVKETLILDKAGIIKEVLLDGITAGYVCGKLFKRAVISEIRFAEDKLFVIQVLLKCENVVFLPKAMYNYIQRTESATGTRFNEKIYTITLALDRITEIIVDLNNEELFESLCAIKLSNAVSLLWCLYYSGLQKSGYCKEFQIIRKNISIKRLRKIKAVTQMEAVLIAINFNLYFYWLRMKLYIKYVLGK